MSWFGRREGSVGVDIGSRYLKLVGMKHGGGGPEVTRIAVRRLPGDGQGGIASRVETLAELLHSSGLQGRGVVAGVGGHDVMVKRVEMERMSPSELREVIRWEAEPHLSLDVRDVELDFQIVSDGDPMDVLLVAARRELVAGTIEVTEAAGLEVRVVDINGFALCNVFALNCSDAAEGVAVLADVGWETTTMVVLEDGVPATVRDFPAGIRTLRDRVQSELGVGPEQADAVVEGRRPSSGLPALVELSADEVAMAIERGLALRKGGGSGLGPGHIRLSGGGARIPGFAQALGRILNIETRIANPFEQIPVRPDACAGVDLDQLGPMLFLCAGLALRRPSRSRNP